MTTNLSTLKATTRTALRSTDDQRWHRAILKAAKWLKDSNTPRTLPNGHTVIASRTNSTRCYEVNGQCSCRQATHGAGICWHRAAAKLYRNYTELEALRSQHTYEGRALVVSTTPGGELVLEDELTGRAFSVESIKAYGPGILDTVSREPARKAA